MPTIKPVSISAQIRYFSPKQPISQFVIDCAAPLSAINFPNIAPRHTITTIEPSISPMPFSRERGISASGTPSKIPATIDAMRNAIKGLKFQREINNTNNRRVIAIAKIAINKLFFRFSYSAQNVARDVLRAKCCQYPLAFYYSKGCSKTGLQTVENFFLVGVARLK